MEAGAFGVRILLRHYLRFSSTSTPHIDFPSQLYVWRVGNLHWSTESIFSASKRYRRWDPEGKTEAMLLVLDMARSVKVTSNIKLNLRLFFFFERSEICWHVSHNGTQKRGRIITSSNGKIPSGVMQASRPHDIQNSAFIFLWKTSGLNHKCLSCGVQSVQKWC